MAEHMQQQILRAMTTTLRLAGTDAGERVREEALDLMSIAELPALDLVVGDESIAYVTGGREGNATQQRELQIEVACVVEGGSDYRARAAALQAQVEECLSGAAPTLLSGLIAGRPRLVALRPQGDAAGAKTVYLIRGFWQCRYFTVEGAPRGPASTSI